MLNNSQQSYNRQQSPTCSRNSENILLSWHMWQVAPESTIQLPVPPACRTCSTISASLSPLECCPTDTLCLLLLACCLDFSFSAFNWRQSLRKCPCFPQWKHRGPFLWRDTDIKALLEGLLPLSCCFRSSCRRCSVTTSIFGTSALASRAVTRTAKESGKQQLHGMVYRASMVTM